jgi:hypothetical protein
LFCGITLKHYAYHNMSVKAQRSTKYMFRTLAQLSENFIFIYLGLSLFTQLQLVYKPLFIIITAVRKFPSPFPYFTYDAYNLQLAACVARYFAVFPISRLVNLIFRMRGSLSDEIPRSYQTMLYWAGLRGAVGVALAAGLKGDHAIALRTTVLVTVVLTVIVFGGTTTRMVEILGIRTGVEDDDDSSSDDGITSYQGISMWNNPKYADGTGHSASEFPYRDAPSRIPGIRSPAMESLRSSEGSDTETLDEPPSARPGDASSRGAVWRDGQWFTVIDENYLLPVFSNATASRRQASRKALRQSYTTGSPDLSGGSFGEDINSLGVGGSSSRGGRHSWMGVVNSAGGVEGPAGAASDFSGRPLRDFTASFSSVINSLKTSAGEVVGATKGGGGNGSGGGGGGGRHKRRESDSTVIAATNTTANGDGSEATVIELGSARRGSSARNRSTTSLPATPNLGGLNQQASFSPTLLDADDSPRPYNR